MVVGSFQPERPGVRKVGREAVAASSGRAYDKPNTCRKDREAGSASAAIAVTVKRSMQKSGRRWSRDRDSCGLSLEAPVRVMHHMNNASLHNDRHCVLAGVHHVPPYTTSI